MALPPEAGVGSGVGAAEGAGSGVFVGAWSGVLVDAVVVVMTVVIAYQAGTRWLKLSRTESLLVGAGSAICGAAAVLATEPVVRGKAEQVSVAVAGVVIFGTIAMFLYPAMYELSWLQAYISAGPEGFGVYIGSTVHEVAQVVAAGRQVGAEAAAPALIAKMTRVFMMAPFLVGLAVWMRGSGAGEGEAMSARRALASVPVFAFYFVGTVCLNSLIAHMGWLSPSTVNSLFNVAVFLLSMAMGALGLSTHFGTLRKAGGKALVLTALLFVWLVAGGAVLNHYAHQLFG